MRLRFFHQWGQGQGDTFTDRSKQIHYFCCKVHLGWMQRNSSVRFTVGAAWATSTHPLGLGAPSFQGAEVVLIHLAVISPTWELCDMSWDRSPGAGVWPTPPPPYTAWMLPRFDSSSAVLCLSHDPPLLTASTVYCAQHKPVLVGRPRILSLRGKGGTAATVML